MQVGHLCGEPSHIGHLHAHLDKGDEPREQISSSSLDGNVMHQMHSNPHGSSSRVITLAAMIT